MSIKWYELKKVFASPIIIGLIVLFTGFNLFIIISESSVTKELAVLNKLVDRFGYQITDEMRIEFDKAYSQSLQEMNELTADKIGKTYKSAAQFTSSSPVLIDPHNPFTEQEVKDVSALSITENYYLSIPRIAEAYEEMNMMQIAESQMSMQMHKVSGQAEKTVRKQYAHLSARFAELKENGEHMNLFFIGTIYKMHSFLFKNLLGLMLYQLMILIVLMTANLLNYEFDNKTHLLTYSTRRGRRVTLDKLLVSLLSSVIVTTVIIGVTLAAYFIVYDYSGVWQVPISTGFNNEYELPYISWWNLTFIQYLIGSVILIYACQILFVMIAFVLSAFIRNSYFVFFLFGLLFGASILLTTFIPPSSNAVFIPYFNPFPLILNSSRWFMMKSIYTTFQYYEIATVTIWSILLCILGSMCLRRLKKQNIL
jgi:hypothetical protein